MYSVTKREMELLKICWQKGEATAREIHEESLKTKKRSYVSVKTILDIMYKKDILKRRKIGPVYLYSPKKNKKNFIIAFLNDVRNKMLNGNIVPIFINFIKNTKLTREQIDQLKKMIDEIEEVEE